MNYDIVKIIHLIAAVAATGPLLFAPWLSSQLKNCQAHHKDILLKGLSLTDRYYNIAGWIIMISGVVMFCLHDWHRLFQLWFVLSVVIFVVDSLAEKKWRDPANESLRTLMPDDQNWLSETKTLHKAVITQMSCTALIFIVMLLHSQLNINLLNLKLY